MKIRARIVNKGIVFSSDKAKAMLLEHNNTDIVIEVVDKPSLQMRRFFEGAVVPAVYYQHPESGWETFKDCREALKLEFLPLYVTRITGGKERVSQNTGDLTKEKFRTFLDKIMRWLEEQGLEMPDPEDYKSWRDSAPAADEIYPPLLRLRESYIMAKK